MLNISLPSIDKKAEDIQLEAKYLFPNNTEKQLRWCAAKGMLTFATMMAHFLRTSKDNNKLVFPNIFNIDGQTNKSDSPQQRCAKSLYHAQSMLVDLLATYKTQLENNTE